jgi:sterol desaturase/sphingolipid hydroxylase (fatty acid hydroxylase superfamily)
MGLPHLAGVRLSAAAVLGFLVLDLVLSGQHVLFHKMPVLWRLHRMHHADLDVDVSSKLANQLGVDYTHHARSQEFGR